jgi:FemAB-related protein (PEP-CTERM system-associated)
VSLDSSLPPQGGCVVRELGVADCERWDRFLAGCGEATFFHLCGWRRVLEAAFGQRGHFLYAEEGGVIRGVLPLARQRSRLFGDALISTPFCVYGGVAGQDDRARAALEQAAVELARRLGVDYLEFRNTAPRRADWIRQDHFCTFGRPIEPDPEKNLLAIPRKQRAEVRKGIRRGLTIAVEDDPTHCYDLYAASVHRLGSPVYARRYFGDLKAVFGDACEFLVVLAGGRAVAGLVNFYFRDLVLPYYAGSAAAGRDGEVHPFMYWSLMNHAAARGARRFDFGRSMRGTGAFAFKQNFGFEPVPLHYEYHLVRGRAVPELNPLNPRVRLLTGVWRRLPAWFVNAVGPWAARRLG